MTTRELSQLYHLSREIEDCERKLAELELQRGNCSVQLDDMPHAKGPKKSKVEQLAAEIVDLQAIIHAKQIECLHEKNRLERYIKSISDGYMRRIFTYRFAECMTWMQVAQKMGGGNTPDSVRMACKRYMDKTE